MESDSVCNHTSDYKIGRHLPINHKDYNFREAQEMKILLGNNHVEILGTRSLTTLKIHVIS